MIELNNENFEERVNNESGLFLVKFSSPTCGPCQSMKPVFEKLSQDNNEINFYEVDTMKSPELASHFGVRGVPYIAFCEGREVLYEFTGLTPLGNMQFVINNIDDPFFRENGHFQKSEQKKSWTFEIIVFVISLALILGIVFL